MRMHYLRAMLARAYYVAAAIVGLPVDDGDIYDSDERPILIVGLFCYGAIFAAMVTLVVALWRR